MKMSNALNFKGLGYTWAAVNVALAATNLDKGRWIWSIAGVLVAWFMFSVFSSKDKEA